VAGEPGPAVVIWHVDSTEGGLDVFGRLHELRPGDEVTVHHADSARTFAVTDLSLPRLTFQLDGSGAAQRIRYFD
jgi:sortase (surface protein transpeptidase)